MRHVVPVDRQARARQVRSASESNSTAIWKLPELLVPARRLDHLFDAGIQAHRSNSEIVRGKGIRRNQMSPPHLSRIEPKLFGNLVDLNLECEARLGCSVSALGSAWGL